MAGVSLVNGHIDEPINPDRDRLIELIKNAFSEENEKRDFITEEHTADYLLANGVTFADHPTEKVCTGERCPMQVGYDVENCKNKECMYRTETEKGGGSNA